MGVLLAIGDTCTPQWRRFLGWGWLGGRRRFGESQLGTPQDRGCKLLLLGFGSLLCRIRAIGPQLGELFEALLQQGHHLCGGVVLWRFRL